MWLTPIPRPAISTRPAGSPAQPDAPALRSRIGDTLLGTRGDVVLLTPNGQQIGLVNPRTVAARVKPGWPVRDGSDLHLNASPPTTLSPVHEC